jgi:hypothetical protein
MLRLGISSITRPIRLGTVGRSNHQTNAFGALRQTSSKPTGFFSSPFSSQLEVLTDFDERMRRLWFLGNLKPMLGGVLGSLQSVPIYSVGSYVKCLIIPERPL